MSISSSKHLPWLVLPQSLTEKYSTCWSKYEPPPAPPPKNGVPTVEVSGDYFYATCTAH